VANLECPLFDGSEPIPKTGPHLRGPKAGAALVRGAGFGAVTLANNHILDHGDAGLRSTLEACVAAGLEYVGAGRDEEEAGRPLIVERGGFRLGLIGACEAEFSIAGKGKAGANWLDPVRLWRQIEANRGRWDALVVLLHAGREHYRFPTPRQRDFCRWLVELGASAVICQHSHCVGTFERVGDAVIVYGQGNFLFPPVRSVQRSWYESVVVDLHLTERGLVDVRLIPSFQPISEEVPGGGAAARVEAIVPEMERRSADLAKPGFVWLTGSRFLDKLRFRGSAMLSRGYDPFSEEAKRTYSVLFRCETHREVIESLLEDDHRPKGSR
jgi:poly-gamma-glutamate synthesis protein (capsule biosynthesis protein)